MTDVGVEFPITLPKGISWTLFRRAEECHKKAEHHRRKVPKANDRWPTYYADIGSGVQRIFEEYFNQGVNLRPGGTAPGVVARVAEKVLADSTYLRELFDATTYPEGKARADMLDQIRSDCRTGLHALHAAGLLERKVRSEVECPGQIRGWDVFGWVDFLAEWPDGAVEVWDGKAVSQMGADAGQPVFYSLAYRSRGIDVRRAGLVYFRQGKARPVPVTNEALRAFAVGRFKPTETVWEAMKAQVTELAATAATRHTCYRCEWSATCPASQMAGKLHPDFEAPPELDDFDI